MNQRGSARGPFATFCLRVLTLPARFIEKTIEQPVAGRIVQRRRLRAESSSGDSPSRE
jgi:hypothetical protein